MFDILLIYFLTFDNYSIEIHRLKETVTTVDCDKLADIIDIISKICFENSVDTIRYS